MVYSKVTLTSKGLEVLARSQASGKKLVLDSLALGRGEMPLLEGAEKLNEQMQSFKFDSITQVAGEENRIALKVSVNNRNLQEGYEIREVGIFAKYDEEKVLYAFINTEGGDYDKLNAYSTEKDYKEIIFYIEIVVGNSENFTISLNEEGLRQQIGVLQEKVQAQEEVVNGIRREFTEVAKTVEEKAERKAEELTKKVNDYIERGSIKNSIITFGDDKSITEVFSDGGKIITRFGKDRTITETRYNAQLEIIYVKNIKINTDKSITQTFSEG